MELVHGRVLSLSRKSLSNVAHRRDPGPGAWNLPFPLFVERTTGSRVQLRTGCLPPLRVGQGCLQP